MNVLIFILVCYGACNNMVYGSLFNGFRNALTKMGTGGYSLHKLFTCMMCLPTWMGFVISLMMMQFGLAEYAPFGTLGAEHMVLSVFLSGLLSTGGVWVLHTLQERLER